MESSNPSRLRALRRTAYLAGPVVVAAALALALSLHGREVVSPGPLSGGHALLDGDCARCHNMPFDGLRALVGVPRAAVMNGACLDCHGHRIGGDPIAASVVHGRGNAASLQQSCSGCHAEHRGHAHRQGADDGSCVSCHGKTEKRIATFDARGEGAHPDFLPAAGSDPGTIRFNHALHVTGAGSNGRVAMSCAECHHAERYQAPIEYERHCRRCHSITTSFETGAAVEVPHVAPAAVRAHLVNEAVKPRNGSSDATTEPSIAAAERKLYENDDGCAKCHRVLPRAATAASVPALAPSRIPERWYARARFDHGRHTAIAFRGSAAGAGSECLSCHSSVLVSTGSADVGVPGIETCRQCHGADRKVSSECVTCHTFHLPPSSGAPDDHALVAAGLEETRFGLRSSSALWPMRAFSDLPRAVWGMPDARPGTPAFNREIFRRYGLFPADFDNDGLPLGLLKVREPFGNEDGITVSCEFCHSSSLFGRIVAGQPNRFSDLERIWIDLGVVSGERREDPLYKKTPFGNTVVNGADQLGLLGLMMRRADLTLDVTNTLRIAAERAGDLKPEFDALAYVKTPPWYVYRTKQSGSAGYYFDGGHPKDGNFAAFTYLPTFRHMGGDELRQALTAWQRSGHAYLASIEAPPYPFPVDASGARRGRGTYDRLCADCHGHYGGERATPATLRYPGLVTPVAQVGTDPMRADFPPAFAQRTKAILHETYTLTHGYVAQPLTAIWAQAPYLHNGSVPTLLQLLEPSRRIARYVLVADPNEPRDFDQVEVGWRVEPLSQPPKEPARAFDPSLLPGLGNQGHIYGAELSSEERADLIEFLKTL